VLGLLGGCTTAGTGTATPSASTPVTDSATPPTPTATTPSAPGCDFLPAGVDPRACDAPTGSAAPIPESTEFPGLYVLSTDDGRIRCDLNAYGEFAACAVGSDLTPPAPVEECDAGDWDNNFVYLWKTGTGDWDAGQGACRGDPLTSEMAAPPALPEGTVLVDGDLAVLAAPGGIVVWNGTARHGFAVLDNRVVTW